MTAKTLCILLTNPEHALSLTAPQWTCVLTIAHAERLIATLAYRLQGLALPHATQSILEAAYLNAESGRIQALWEVEMARRALAPLNIRIVLLKGSAFAAAGLSAAQGRLIGDLDILVPRADLVNVEAAILASGWEWVKPNAYDDQYYRRWMHELPPLIHRDRHRMIDIHHTILPLTAKARPDAASLMARASPLQNGLFVLSPTDMIVHAAAHLIADGELDGGLRNVWDIDRLIREHCDADEFWSELHLCAEHHGLTKAVNRALRLAGALFATPQAKPNKLSINDRLFLARMLARDGWGRNTHHLLQFIFTVRGHLLRMPLPLLLRHLWIKARMNKAIAAEKRAIIGGKSETPDN